MNLEEYRENFLADIDIENSETGDGTVATFTKMYLDELVGFEKISDYKLSYYELTTTRGVTIRIDAYIYDNVENSMNLFITSFDGSDQPNRLTQSDVKDLYNKAEKFVDIVLNSNLKSNIEKSSPIRDCVDEITQKFKTNNLTKFKVNIITDRTLSERYTTISQIEHNGIPFELNIWDINRLFLLSLANDIDDNYIVDFTEFGLIGIPCLHIDGTTDNQLKSYLAIFSGELLANIFDKYGSKVLESNVRAFLSTTGKVNKGIRATILNPQEKTKFFAYNNGISVTSSEVITKLIDGQNYITQMKQLQIVNGGQTTASLSSARFKDKASLDGIYIQAKITEIENGDKEEIVRNISRFSNSQNKVSDADFISSHEFSIRMENYSRKTFAPAIDGQQYETLWFFERAKGQYMVAQMKMTKGESNKFKKQNPKSQLLTKTAIGKYRNLWDRLPHIACHGGEYNMKYFSSLMDKEWKKSDAHFNQLYFKETVALAIIYKSINKGILHESWYNKGYASEITNYTISLISEVLKNMNIELNLTKIWLEQDLKNEVLREMLDISRIVYKTISKPNREIENISMWCRKEKCWDDIKQIRPNLEQTINFYSISKMEKSELKKESVKDQKMMNDVGLLAKVIAQGTDFWKEVSEFALNKKLISPKEMDILVLACKMSHSQIPSERQAKILMEIYEKCRMEGFPLEIMEGLEDGF